MTNLAALKAELDAGHPVTGAYSVDDATAADEINAVNIASEIDVSHKSFLGAIKRIHWPTDQAHRDYLIFISQGPTIPLQDPEVQTMLTHATGGIFPTASAAATRTAIMALWATTISRAQELNLGRVATGTVQNARMLP